MLPLRLSTQSYSWDVPAAQASKVLELARANGVEGLTSIDPKEPLAELWSVGRGVHMLHGSCTDIHLAAAVCDGCLHNPWDTLS